MHRPHGFTHILGDRHQADRQPGRDPPKATGLLAKYGPSVINQEAGGVRTFRELSPGAQVVHICHCLLGIPAHEWWVHVQLKSSF